MQRYAQSDTHYLLYLHDTLHNEILEAGGAKMLTNVRGDVLRSLDESCVGSACFERCLRVGVREVAV